jgi:membrane protease YdiL (CAAX protease family)
MRLTLNILIWLMLGMLVASAATRFTRSWSNENVQTLNFLIGALGFQGATLVLTERFLREHRTGLATAFGLGNAGLGRGFRQACAAGMGIACVALVLGWISSRIMSFFGQEPEAQTAVQMLQSTDSIARQFLYGVVAVALAPVAEEVLFRGILYPTVKQLGHPRLALWLTALLFGAIHMNLMAMMPLTVVAVLFTLLYEQTNDLLVPILAHSVFNSVNFALLIAGRAWGL